MGKITFTPIQKLIFEEFSKFEPLRDKFYFSGGTALSVFYLHHRYSDDLDFFSENKPEDEILTEFMTKISSLVKLKHRFTKIEETRIFEFVRKNKLIAKVDFSYYPYPRLKKGKVYKKVVVDSLRDIATNKLLAINQRNNVKDFVDLYFLLEKFTIWDLIYGVEAKFRRETDILLLGVDFMKVEEFDFLPRMIAPLKLSDLKKFFRKKALQIASRVVEK